MSISCLKKVMIRAVCLVVVVYLTFGSCRQNDTECHSFNPSENCSTPDCPTVEMVLSETWSCFVSRVMQNISNKCASKVERFDFSLLPTTLYSNLRQSLYYVCRAINSDKSREFLISGGSCSADEYELLVYEVCDPWHTPQPEIISRSCTSGVKSCLTPIINEERTLTWDFAQCMLSYCDQTGIQFLGHRRIEASTILTDILKRLMLHTPLCVEATNCYLEHRPSLQRWYTPFEINFTLCLGAAPEWYQCSFKSNEQRCSKPSVELSMGNLCYQDHLQALGITKECDRQMYTCLHMQAFTSCHIVAQYGECLRKKCTRNEFQKIYYGVCGTMNALGYIFWAAAKVAPDYFNSILHYWKHGLMPAKMYDTRAVMRHECIIFSSRVTRSNYFNISTDILFSDDLAYSGQRRKLVALACKGVPRQPDIDCTAHVLTCFDMNVKTCEDVHEKTACLRERCTKTETDHILEETCQSLSFIEGLRVVILNKDKSCTSKFIRCLDSVYVHGDEWYRTMKVQELLCAAIQSWRFRTCALNSSFCSEEDLMELIMAACLSSAKLLRLPSSNCLDQLAVCNYTFENSCQDLENENLDCIKQACDQYELDKIYFRACKVHSLIKHSLYEIAFQNNSQCVIAIMECFDVTSHWLTMIWNHSLFCSILESAEFKDCLAKWSCLSSESIIASACHPAHEKVELSKRCFPRAKACFAQQNCNEIDANRLCLKDRCTDHESLQIREDLCMSDEYLGTISKAGGDDYNTIKACALKSRPFTFEDRLRPRQLQGELCWAFTNDETVQCVKSNKLNVTNLERAMVMACSSDFDHMNGVADDCTRSVNYCVKTRRPRSCSELTKSSGCFKESCKIFTLKYVIHEICQSLGFIRSVIQQVDYTSETCQVVAWECMEFPEMMIDIWMDVSKLQRRVCILVNQEKYSFCVSENCPPDVYNVLKTAACNVYKKTTALTSMAARNVNDWLIFLAIVLIELFVMDLRSVRFDAK